MGAKQSAETKLAMQYMAEGETQFNAAVKAGIHPSTLRRAMNKKAAESKKPAKKRRG